ncbi:MAG: YfiR family protein [Burkholderiales bacterium]
MTTLCAALAPGMAAAADPESLEYAVKAAYLSKFGLFVEWPATAYASPGSALNVCVVGDDPFGAMLDTAAGGQRIDAHPIAVRRLKTVGRDSGCHILYIGSSEAQRTAQIIAAVRGSGVLTVTDAQGSGATGIVNFVIKDNRVRFDIDEEAAAQNGFAISSKLLSLASNVKRRPLKETAK